MADTRAFKDKFPEFEQELKKLQEKYDILMFPMIERTPNADTAVIKIIDNNDEETKKNFGIVSASTTPPSVLVN